MVLEVQLIGRRAIISDGVQRPLSGRKPWALLAYLVLQRQPQPRGSLADLMFLDAHDPMAALRWCLVQLRRALEPNGKVIEEDRRLRLDANDLVSDVERLLAGAMTPEDAPRLAAGDLLDGWSFPDLPDFDNWLAMQRARLATATTDAARWVATVLAHRDPNGALELLERAVRSAPFDDALHEVAVSIHVSMGDRAGADRYLQRVDRMYRQELGVEAPALLRRPLERPVSSRSGPLLSLDIQARALLDAAEARYAAGDYDGAVSAARRAAAQATASGDTVLEARALTTLAQLLIHTLRGRDQEALGLLGRALQLSTSLERDDLVAVIEREVGYVAFLDARYGAAEAALRRAIALAREVGDSVGAARAQVYLALCESDLGNLDAAEAHLAEAMQVLSEEAQPALKAYAGASLARALVLSGAPSRARTVAAEAVATARAASALGLVPWALVWEAEAAASEGDAAAARELFEEAFTLGAEIGDPCWEGLALRGLARVGADDDACALLTDALARCRRLPDTYKWVEAVILTELVEARRGADLDDVIAAHSLAAAGPIPDLVTRLRPYTAQTVSQTLDS